MELPYFYLFEVRRKELMGGGFMSLYLPVERWG
jgi:hypothetical protein